MGSEIWPHDVAGGIELSPEPVDQFPLSCGVCFRRQQFAQLTDARDVFLEPRGVDRGELPYEILQIECQARQAELPILDLE